ncbi:putative Ig domain-containing protein [Oryzibacter oryziterrae]|uniref:putative Ig domain-containing protein n=1 Tax=Oryzibacter oryziterrae TaxID=2766474 RepID=UPI001F2CC2A4|nr:putative Ig domain-containing protein [Oryzibacter oryziterrae]
MDHTTSSQDFTLTIGPATPTASSVTATVDANSTDNNITLSMTGSPTSVTVASDPSHGVAVASGTAITYTPTAGYSGSDSFTYTAVNDVGSSAAATVSITVSAPTLVLSPTTLLDGTEGVAYAQDISASRGTSPYTYEVSVGTLPAGMSLSSGGRLSGTPSSEGDYSFTVAATDSYGATGTQNYSVNIADGSPSVSAVHAVVDANSTSNTIALDISGTYTSVDVFSAASHGTASASGTTITYTPTVGYAGSDSFTYTATNDYGTSSTATVAVTVTAPTLTLSPSSLDGGMVGDYYSAQLTAGGGTAPYSFALADGGALPDGLILRSDGSIAGVPSSTGNFTFTVTVTDAQEFTASQEYTISVTRGDVPVVSNVSATVAKNSVDNPVPLDIAGTYYWVRVATDPSHGSATVVGDSVTSERRTPGGRAITYTPNPGFSGTDSFTYTAGNNHGTSSTATVTVTVTAEHVVISLSPSSLSDGTVGTAYAAALAASGGTSPYAFAKTSGSLPAGLTLSPAGVLSGTPTEAGDSTFTVTATDADDATGSKTYTVSIASDVPTAPPETVDVDNPSDGSGASIALVTGVNVCVVIDTQPAHGTLTVNADCSVTYVPDAGYSGADSFLYHAVNTVTGARSASAKVSLRVMATIAVTTATGTVPDANVGSHYSLQFTASGGTAPYAFTLVARSSFPAGLSLSRSGLLSGTPTTAGNYSFRMKVTDSLSASATKTISLKIGAKPDPSKDPEVIGIVNAEVDAARRVASTQTSNVNQHLSSLHGSNCLTNSFGAGVSGGETTEPKADKTETAAGASLDRATSNKADAATQTTEGCSTIADGRAAVWTGGSVDFGSAPIPSDAHALDYVSVALSAGVDWRVSPEVIIGAGVGFNRDHTDVSNNGSDVDTKGLSAFAYGSWQPVPKLFVDGLFGYSRLTLDSDRFVTSTGDIVSASRDGDLLFGSLTAGYDWQASDVLKITPYGRLSASRAWLGSASETGSSGEELTYGSQTVDTLTGYVGVKLAWSVAADWGRVDPYLSLEYGHDFAGSSTLDLSYVGSSATFALSSADRASDFGTVGLGADISVGEDLSIGLAYGIGVDKDGVRDQQVNVRLTKRF